MSTAKKISTRCWPRHYELSKKICIVHTTNLLLYYPCVLYEYNFFFLQMYLGVANKFCVS